MQNRYAGDIGDFGKLGLLRALQRAGLSIGVNWYLVPDEQHNNDGKFTQYPELRPCDPELYGKLQKIASSDRRSVAALQTSDLLNAVYFDGELDFRGKTKDERTALRAVWHQKALKVLSDVQLVFVDPDNGLLVPSAKDTPKENKFVTPEELGDYYAQGAGIVYYQHKARHPDAYYARTNEELLTSFEGASGFGLKFKKTSQRYYFFILHPEQTEAVSNAVDALLASPWGDLFEPVMPSPVTGIRLALDPATSPEAVEFFSSHEEESLSPYELATALIKCDRTHPMPRVLFDFIVSLYEEAAGEGDPDGMNDLGALYYDGRGCEQNYAKAVEWYRRAAAAGSPLARENLGYCYYYGRAAEPDYEKAFHCFLPGALEGRLTSLYKIGDMYRNGYYVKKDPAQAFHIYERCLDLMTDEAAAETAGPVYLRLGDAFLQGVGTETNAKNALVCYQRAERFLYDMVAEGDVLYARSLHLAIEGQEKARRLLLSSLPGETKI